MHRKKILLNYNLKKQQYDVLGEYLHWIQNRLKEYWKEYWIKSDQIEQIYFAYLNESPYKKFYQGKIAQADVKKSLHVHIHILPRTQSMGEICDGGFLGWDLLKITKLFNIEYFDIKRKKHLMTFLKEKAQVCGIYEANSD